MKYGRKIFNDLIPLDGKFTERNEVVEDGSDDDPNAVLDTNFKVRGVDGLRIVDASSFPKIPGTYLALPLYMLAEKASDAILADAKASK